jgi:MFS family permease
MTENRKSLFFYGYGVAVAGFWVWFLAFGIYGTFSVFFVPVSTEFHWTRADTALASSLGGVMMGVLGLAMGWLTDKLGPRFVVCFFGSFLGIACLLLSRIAELWHFTILHALILSAGASTASVPIMATVSRWFVKRRGLMSGLVQSGVGIGGFVITPVAGWLISTYGWRTAYGVLGVIALVGIAGAGLFLRRDPREMGLLPDGARKKPAAPDRRTDGRPSEPAPPFRHMMAAGQFWVLAGLYFAFGFCRSTFLVHAGPHVQDLGFSLADAANVLAILNVSSVLGRIGMGRAADVMGVRSAMIISYGATVVDMIWGLITRDLWGLYLYAFIFGFGWGAQAVLRYPATAEVFGLRSAGLIMGILGLFENVLGAGLGIWGAGYVFDTVGSYRPVYWSGLAISVGAVILAALVKPAERRI